MQNLGQYVVDSTYGHQLLKASNSFQHFKGQEKVGEVNVSA